MSEQNVEIADKAFREAFETSPIGMALVSLEGTWLKVNDSLSKIVGYTKEELLQKTFQDITHPEDLDLDLEYVNKMLAGKIQTYQMKKRYKHKSGHDVWVLLSVSLVKDDTGNPQYFVSQIQDITSETNAANELEAKVDELERLNKMMVGREVKMAELKETIKSLGGEPTS